MFGKPSSKKKDSLILVFDIRSSSVGGALFLAQNSGMPKIIFSIREPITLRKGVDAQELLRATAKSLDIVAGKVYKAGLGAPDRIFSVLSSPWHVSQTRIIKLEKNVPFNFTLKLADELIQKELSLFEEEVLKQYANSRGAIRFIEMKTIKTMLNGYESPDPMNRKSKQLEMTVIMGMSGDSFLSRVEDVIKKYFSIGDIKFSSFEVALFTTIRDIFIKPEDFLLVDIGGELTDIALVKENALHDRASFPTGTNFVVSKVASALSSSIEEAKSLISLHKNKHASHSVEKKLESILEKLGAEWRNKFQDSLALLSKEISLPSTIYLFVDKEMMQLFSQAIKDEQFSQYNATDSKFKIINLNLESLHGRCQFQEKVVRDPALIIEALYLNRFFN